MFHVTATASVSEDSDVGGHIAIWAMVEAEGEDSAWLRLRVGECVVKQAKARPPLLAFLFLIIFNMLFKILRCISCVAFKETIDLPKMSHRLLVGISIY